MFVYFCGGGELTNNRMKKLIPTLIILFAIVLIISFLNIGIRSMDTVSAIWAYLYLLYPSGIVGILGILLFIVSLINKSKIRVYYFILGLGLIWGVLLSFYPKYFFYQRYNLINPLSLFVISSIAIIALKIFEYFQNRKTL